MSWAGEGIRHGRPRPVSAFLAAVILGVLAMHVLAQQCTMPSHGPNPLTAAASMTAAPSATSAMVMTSAEPAASSGHGDVNPTARGTVAAPPSAGMVGDLAGSGAEHDTGDMVMLCAQMLLTAAGTLLLLVWLGRATIPYAWVPRLRGVVSRLPNGHAWGGPPYVWEFSVVRC